MTGKPADAWVSAYTTASGMPDPRISGVTAKPRPCTTCGALTLTGYDAPLCAGLAVADPYLLTTTLEAAAVILRVTTYRVWGTAPDLQLTERHRPDNTLRVTRAPADRVPVVAAHRCGYPPLSDIPLPRPARPRMASNVIPY